MEYAALDAEANSAIHDQKTTPHQVRYKNLTSENILACLKEGEYGDGLLFRLCHENQFIYDHNRREWFSWQGNYWERCRRKEAREAVNIVRDLYRKELIRQRKMPDPNPDLADALKKRINALNTLSRRNNILKLAYSGADFSLSGEEWDRDTPHLLACRNGVIDLKTGELCSGVPSDYIRSASPTTYEGTDRNNDCRELVQFILSCFSYMENQRAMEMLGYFQRLFGSCLWGDSVSKDRVFPILWGETGQNGKGTLLEAFGTILGESLARPIRSEMILDQKYTASSSAPTPDIMALKGKRLIWASETKENRRFDLGRVQWLSGGDTLTGRFPHAKDEITFKPSHTLFLMTNYRPHVNPQAEAFWHRAHLIEYRLSWVSNPTKEHHRKRDPDLQKKLEAEASAILAWLVEGCRWWQSEGLNPPDEVLSALEEYRESEDSVKLFLEECCILDDHAVSRAGELYDAYDAWCKKNLGRGEKRHKGRGFGEEIRKQFSGGRDRRGNFYQGIGIIAEAIPLTD